MGQWRRLESLLQECDVVHGAVQSLGRDGVGVADQGPRIRCQPARSLGLPRVGELAAGARQDPGEPVDGVAARGFSRHG
jgi:hypothetical protein